MININQKKKDATDFLNRKGRRIEIIFFGLLLVFVTIVPLYVWSYIEYFSLNLFDFIVKSANLSESLHYALTVIAYVLSICCGIAATIFITLPTYACFFGHSYRLYREGIAGGRRYFAFGERGYLGALKSGSIIFGVFALCLLPVIVFIEIGTNFAFSDDARVAQLVSYLFFFIVALGLAVGFCVFLLFKPIFLFGYYIARGEKVFFALSKSIKRMRSPRAKKLYKEYINSFLPSLMLSVVTLLVYFLIDTLPKMSMVYFDVADDIIYNE